MSLPADLEAVVSARQQSGRYEVLRRFKPRGRYADPDGPRTVTTLAVDVETTGLDPAQHRVIQFSAAPLHLRAGHWPRLPGRSGRHLL